MPLDLASMYHTYAKRDLRFLSRFVSWTPPQDLVLLSVGDGKKQVPPRICIPT
jgi:hypothetical protein